MFLTWLLSFFEYPFLDTKIEGSLFYSIGLDRTFIECVTPVTGYFHDETPPKEWCSPFAEIFPNYNIFAFDWRGVGESEGENRFMRKNDFGRNAYPDIQAAIDYIRQDNDKPIILHGFCFGGAMAIYATLRAQAEGRNLPDALGLSCMYSQFENLFERAFLVEDRWFYYFLMCSGVGKWVLDYMMNGSLFDLNSIDLIQLVNEDIPCWFDHYTKDPFAILSEGIKVYEKTKSKKYFVQGDLGNHVRVHGKTPAQYRNAYKDFLQKFVFPNNKRSFLTL